MDADAAALHLRRKVVERLRSGSHGLLRCWVHFRTRAGGTKDGIAFDEFRRALRSYDLPIAEDACRALFSRMDTNGDGRIHMREFVEHVLGRWDARANTIDGIAPPRAPSPRALPLVRSASVETIRAKLPRSPRRVRALHQALYAAEHGASSGVLRGTGAFARTLRKHDVALTRAELDHVAEVCAPTRARSQGRDAPIEYGTFLRHFARGADRGG